MTASTDLRAAIVAALDSDEPPEGLVHSKFTSLGLSNMGSSWVTWIDALTNYLVLQGFDVKQGEVAREIRRMTLDGAPYTIESPTHTSQSPIIRRTER